MGLGTLNSFLLMQILVQNSDLCVTDRYQGIMQSCKFAIGMKLKYIFLLGIIKYNYICVCVYVSAICVST